MTVPDDGLLLMTPGPTRLPERVRQAGARPMVHHRSATFLREWAAMLELIAPLFGTREPVLPVHTTGRGAMESVVANLLSPGDTLIVCANGRFGALWGTLATTYGVNVRAIATDWSHDIELADVAAALEKAPGAKAVALAHSDTSTGVANDISAIAQVARAHGAMVFVDGVSSIGGMPFAMDEWGVDAALTASQKCLMSSPGLAFVALSERAMASTAHATSPRNYWDFRDIRQRVAKLRPEPPGTPPIQVVNQVSAALRMIHEEGPDAVCRRHERMSTRVREGLSALGLSLQCPDLRRYSTTLTAVAAPASMPAAAIRDGVEAEGVLIAAGLGPYESRAFRIGHMGDIQMADVERTLTALSGVLHTAPRIG